MRALIIALVLAPTLAHAAEFCAPTSPRAPHDMMLQTLQDHWKEKIAENATIRGSDGEIIGLFEITASDKGTWTALATDAAGITCMMGSGADYSGSKAKPKGTQL